MWNEALGLGQYAQALAENDIDLALLPQLSDADLKELGVTSLGHRKRILAAIAGNSPSPSLDAQSSSPGERRQVTVLFADLCNFTGLAQALDAEELRDLVGRFEFLPASHGDPGVCLAEYYGGGQSREPRPAGNTRPQGCKPQDTSEGPRGMKALGGGPSLPVS